MLLLIYNFYKIGLFSWCFFDSVILTFSFILPFHLIFNFCCVCKVFVKCFIQKHCRRLCKTTEIFVIIENGFLFNIYIYNIYITYIYIYISIFSVPTMSLIYAEKFEFENPAIMEDKQTGSDYFLSLDGKSKQR